MKYRTPSYGESTFDYYFFEKNLQGDIIAVYSGAGTKLCTFKYDAWGNSTISYETGVASSTKWFLNDHCVFRYRGYYYDSETGYYYLQSRYYNPTWGRFLNADGYINANGDILGFNMFAYCSNNPVMFVDPTGEALTALAIAAGLFASTVLGAIIGALFEVGTTLGDNPGATQEEILASMAKGAISGGVMGLASGIMIVTGGSAGLVVGVYAAAGFIGSSGGSIVENAIKNEKLIGLDVLDSGLQGAVFGAIAGGIEGPLLGLKKLAKQYGTTYAKQAIRFGKNSYKHMGGSALEGGLSSFYELYIDRTILLFCNTATGRTK